MMLYSCRMPRISPGLPLLSLSLCLPLFPPVILCFPFLLIHCSPLPLFTVPFILKFSLSLSLSAACLPASLPARPTRLSVRGCGGGDLKEVEDVSGRTGGRTRKEEEERREKESPVRLSLSPPSSNSDPLSQPSSLTDCNLGLRIDAFPACLVLLHVDADAHGRKF